MGISWPWGQGLRGTIINAADYILGGSLTGRKVALFHNEERVTYSKLRLSSMRMAHYLYDKGLKKGDRVVLIGDSSYFWVASYLGTLLAGGVSVPLPSNVDPRKLEKIMASIQPRWIISESKHLKRLCGVLEGYPVIASGACPSPLTRSCTAFSDILKGKNTRVEEFFPIDENNDLAALMFTSGSTGEPRGVMISHGNIRANTESIIQYLNLTREDRIMSVLPFYYCFGTSLLHTHLRAGGSVVIDNRFMFPEVVLRNMRKMACTGLAGVPSTFQILLRNSTLKQKKFPRLRYVQQAGGKLPDLFIRELVNALPGTEVVVMYGQTEATARLSYLPPALLGEKFGSIGKGIPGVKLMVMDEEGNPVPPGVTGEIVAEGENIALGYWNEPAATAKSFRNHRLYTGDLARVDEDGFIFVVDRAKDFLKCGGQRIGSKEIENVILGFPGIIELAVVGQPDEKLGEAVRLYIVHQEGESMRRDLETFCGKNLEWSFVPRKIIFLKALPKNSYGKIDKSSLKPDVFDIRK